MTPSQRGKLARRMMELVELRQWELAFAEDEDAEECGDDTYGQCAANPETYRAVIWLHPDIEEEDEAGTLAHEILHVVLAEYSHAAGAMASTDAEREWLRLAEERVVRALENLLADAAAG